jgi:hypothetical protein
VSKFGFSDLQENNVETMIAEIEKKNSLIICIIIE